MRAFNVEHSPFPLQIRSAASGSGLDGCRTWNLDKDLLLNAEVEGVLQNSRQREKDQGESQCKSSQSYKFDLNSGCILFNDDEGKSGDDGDSNTEQRHNNNILLNMHKGDLCCPTTKLKVVR